MRLQNSTNIPDSVLRALIADVCPPGVTNVRFKFQNVDYGGRGRGGSGHVLVKVPRTERLARRLWHQDPKTRGAYLPMAVGSRMEVLVMILAHELRHCWQTIHRRGWRVWGSRGMMSERDADAWGLKMLRKFRRGELSIKPVPAQLEPIEESKVNKKFQRRANRETAVLKAHYTRMFGRHIPDGAFVEGETLYAPQGQRFAATGCHWIEYRSHDKSLIHDDVAEGLESCQDQECDYCHPQDEEAVA